MSLARLRVADEAFLVSSLIERCPRVMMLRELVRNAIEAACTAPPGQRTVEIGAMPIGGVPKLFLRNGGRGMDDAELARMADLASSIRKPHGLDRNFGMGAKVASLPSNRHGLRYRSCHAARVHEVTLGWRDGVYGKLLRQAADGGWHEVVEATEDAQADGRAVRSDWTEVVLFGNRPDQDTSLDPYDGAPPVPPGWLEEHLAARFFRVGHGVALLLHGQPFRPLSQRLERATRYEQVLLPDGVRLHYGFDATPPDDADDPMHDRVRGRVALLHRDELYDGQDGAAWQHMAPAFGLPFGAGSITVLVELPDRHPVVPDGYRQFLRHAGGRQDMIVCRQFAPLVHRHRPAWLLEIVAAAAPAAQVSAGVRDAIGRLLGSLRVPRRRRAVSLLPVTPALPAPFPAANDRGGADGAAPAGADTTLPGPEPFEVEPVPEILLLRRPDDIESRGLRGRAGRYYPETHQLFLNAAYPAVDRMRDLLEREFAAWSDQAALRAAATTVSEQDLAGRVGRMLVFALSKQDSWPDGDVAQALSPHALSLAADDLDAGLEQARAAMRQALADALSGPMPAAAAD